MQTCSRDFLFIGAMQKEDKQNNREMEKKMIKENGMLILLHPCLLGIRELLDGVCFC